MQGLYKKSITKGRLLVLGRYPITIIGRALCGLVDSMISDTKLTLLNQWIVVSKQSIKRCTGNRCLYGMWLITVPYGPIPSADTINTLTPEQQQWQNRQAWWRHQMETFSALLAICAGNPPVPGEFPAQRPVTRRFDVLFDLRLNKRLNK